MFGFGSRKPVKEVQPGVLFDAMQDGEVILVDVREPGEFASMRIPGAINMPLSRFDPSQLPRKRGKRVVLQCASGMRSAKAFRMCDADTVDSHLAGGIGLWKRVGLPVER